MKTFQNRRIAIFNPYPGFDTNPTLVCLTKALTNHGSHVDIMVPPKDIWHPVDGNVTVNKFPEGLALWCGDVRTTMKRWRQDLSMERLRIDLNFATGTYDVIIGVDSLGIIRGSTYAKRYKVPLVYLSFEIFFKDELVRSVEIEEKQREVVATRIADLVIVQDAYRGRMLGRENRLMRDKFAYLPVAPSGTLEREKSNYLRDRHNIPEDHTIVLISGSFENWTCANEILDSLSEWPEKFVLVVHSKLKVNEKKRYIRKINGAGLTNIILSNDSLPIGEYEQLVASADMGLVMYKAIPPSRYLQKNIGNIGLASGKFSFYVKHGIPVISLTQKIYEELFKEYKFGANIHSLDALPDALIKVRSRMNYHRKEARRLFKEKLDFDAHWPTISARLLEIMK